MAISAIKGLGKAFIKRSRAKAAEKMKKLNKRDTLRFQGVYKKHRKMLERLNKPAKDELDKTLKSIKGRITKGKSKDDMKDMMKAYDRYNSKVMRKDKVKMYDDLPDIRQRFRGAPGPQRKITRGMKNYMRRAEALQKDRLKRLGPIRGDKKIMARFSKGRRALAISDRSGAAFPYDEMVQEWTGAWVHTSEFEPKQPQLQPRPVAADAQALQHAKPARVEFPVEDILPNNPFTTTAASGTLSVSYPFNQINYGTSYVRFRSVKQPVGGVAVSTLELTTTLNGNISDSATTITLTDATEFPTSGFIMIEKIDTTPDTDNYGKYFNEVIQYTGKAGNNLTGCTRGTAAPFKGETLQNTTATTHSSGANVFGSYLATAIGTTVITGAQPATETQYNSITVPLVSNAASTETGGGFQCTIGPINDKA